MATVIASTLFTASPATARDRTPCETVAILIEYSLNMYQWHGAFYGRSHDLALQWAATHGTFQDIYDTFC